MQTRQVICQDSRKYPVPAGNCSHIEVKPEEKVQVCNMGACPPE